MAGFRTYRLGWTYLTCGTVNKWTLYISLPPSFLSVSLVVFFFSFICVLVATLHSFCPARLLSVCAYISCKIVMRGQGNLCVCMTCHEDFTCVSGTRITLSISWGLGWFPSLCECHQGQQSSYYLSRVESGRIGTVWKLPVILLMVPARTCCIPLKKCGLQQLSSPHSISKREIHTRSPVLQEVTAAALSTDISVFKFLSPCCNSE